MTVVTLLTSIRFLAAQKNISPVILLDLYTTFLVIHISLATIAVLLGIFQFLPQIRIKRPQVHRISGRIYVGCVLVSGLTAFFVAFFTAGSNEQVAFIALDVLWLLSLWKAFRAIRQKKVVKHRLWIVRNYALTLVALFARLVVPILILLRSLQGSVPAGGIGALLAESLGTGVWLSMVFNLVIADWLVNRNQKENRTE